MPIRLEQVKVYADSCAILDGIDLTLEDGTITIIVGRTGSGKSTLLQTIAELRKPDAGNIRITRPARETLKASEPGAGRVSDEEPTYGAGRASEKGANRIPDEGPAIGVVSLTESRADRVFEGEPADAAGSVSHSRANRVSDEEPTVGLTLQYAEHQLFERSVRREFDYALKPFRLTREQRKARTERAMTDAALAERLLERAPVTLSGGEKRRVALAVAFAAEPDWLLLDEPTAALDPPAAAAVAASLRRRLAGDGCTGGIVIATHDLDTFLPMSDRVIVLRSGRVEADTSFAELARDPAPLLRADVGLPGSLATAAALAAVGVPNAAVLRSADETADAIARFLTGPDLSDCEPPHDASDANVRGCLDGNPYKRDNWYDPLKEHPHNAEQPSPDEPGDGNRAAVGDVMIRRDAAERAAEAHVVFPNRHTAEATPSRFRLVRLDPRSKWLFLILASIGILAQQRLTGVLLAAVITAALTTFSDAPLRKLARMAKPFVVLLVMSVLLAGLRLTPSSPAWREAIGFDPQAAYATFFPLAKTLLVFILGLLFAETTPARLMKRAVERSFGFLARFRVPVEPVALGFSLLLRFIPLIHEEWDRFALMIRARRTKGRDKRTLRLRELRAAAVPLLLAVLQLADDMATAMEVRGYRPNANRGRVVSPLSWNGRDTGAVAAGVACCVLLLAVR